MIRPTWSKTLFSLPPKVTVMYIEVQVQKLIVNVTNEGQNYSDFQLLNKTVMLMSLYPEKTLLINSQ